MVPQALILSAMIGFSTSWSVTPAGPEYGGTVLVTAHIEEDDFVFVREDGRESASYEILASLDDGAYSRAGGTLDKGSLPFDSILELSGIEPGSHRLIVVLRDLESGRRRTSESTVEVPQLNPDSWSAGGLSLDDGPSNRISGRVAARWQVFPPTLADTDPDSIEVAYLLRSESGVVASEGWMTGDGNGLYSADIALGGLEPGSYELLAAAVLGDAVVAASGSSLDVRSDWDVWGRDAGVTRMLIRPIATSSELHALDEAGSESERFAAMSEFWQERDPNPLTETNEYMQSYLARLDLIMDRFTVAGVVQGIATDMGRVYALLGEPDIVEDMPFELGSIPYQIWTYFSPSLTVVFVDDDGYGMYEMTTSWDDVRRAHEH